MNSNTAEREIIALYTYRYGFSVVDAISVIRPSSINSRSDCCCFLLKYWISSRYRSIPPVPMSVEVSAIISFISEREAEVAFSFRSVIPDPSAMIRAAVVFPVPGGP